MRMEWLRVNDVRNLSAVHIAPGPKLNVVSGPNASGKTALLEAIHFLGRCRSFRVAGVDQVVRHGQKTLEVSAGVRRADESLVVTGVQRGRGQLNIRYNGRDVRRVSEQAAQFPVIAVTPASGELVLGEPALRRRWLDWSMFHVKHDYMETWRAYYKALKCRNNLLRENLETQLSPWEEAMRRAADRLAEQRQGFLEELSAELARLAEGLALPLPTLAHERGWRDGAPLDQCLAEQRREDLEKGRTRCGLQRSDILMVESGRKLRHFYSRGQIKQFMLILSLAQGNVFRRRTGLSPILLVDDLTAELDGDGQARMLDMVAAYDGQVFVTTTGAGLLPGSLPEQKMFHVKHGVVAEP